LGVYDKGRPFANESARPFLQFRSSYTLKKFPVRTTLALLIASFMVGACGGAKDAESSAAAASDHSAHTIPGLPAPVIPAGVPYTAADVHFMQGMIAHHGQAIAMARMAASHGANPQLLRFTLKIDLSQRAEIALMQQWLRDRNQHAPDSTAHLHIAMPGMLTAEQMKQLDAAKGAAFDKLFLELMIQHHEGAIKMVADLLAEHPSPEPDLYNLAVDIDFDQRAEIEKMHEMLGNL
jgi:uncharacterized protein (DUF305 family)